MRAVCTFSPACAPVTSQHVALRIYLSLKLSSRFYQDTSNQYAFDSCCVYC